MTGNPQRGAGDSRRADIEKAQVVVWAGAKRLEPACDRIGSCRGEPFERDAVAQSVCYGDRHGVLPRFCDAVMLIACLNVPRSAGRCRTGARGTGLC